MMEEKLLVSVNDCWYRYQKHDNFVLQGVNVSLVEGKHYGIVGKNGSGKTTLVKLITGSYNPTEGKVIIRPDALAANSSVHVLFQDFGVYPITVRDFLELGNKKDIPEELLIEALRIVSMEKQIYSLPKNINTPMTLVADHGTKFSRGELQRLAIARAWLSDAKLIIFDEPTSSLDVLTEKQIYEACLPHFANRTLLVISHRLGLIKGLDLIYVLESGHIVESGLHEDLLVKSYTYKSLYENQRRLFTLDGIG